MSIFHQFREWFIHEKLIRLDDESLQKARLIVYISFAGFLHGLVFSFFWLYEEIPLGAIANLLSLLLVLAVLFVFRLKGSTRFASHALALVLNLNLLFKIYLTGGQGEYALYWNILIPMFMTMINGLGSAIFWVGIVILEVAAYYILVYLNIPFPELVPPERYRIIEFAATIALICMVVIFNYFNEMLKKQYVCQLRETQKILKWGKERYALATDAGHVGVWEWYPGSDDIYLDPNLRKMMGISADEVLGGLGGWMRLIATEDIPQITPQIEALSQGKVERIEFHHRIVGKSGINHWLLTRASVVEYKNGKPYRILGAATDITNEKQTAEELRIALKEKDLLFKELNHRVKNNMQVITSLLNLSFSEVDDGRVAGILKEGQRRVKAMALVHERLSQSKNFSHLPFKSYIYTLAERIFYLYGIKQEQICLKIEGDDISLHHDIAVACALIVNEILTNALKHAFPEGHSGEIKISLLALEQNRLRLTISDNGVGLPADFDLSSAASIGFKIVDTLVKQMGGKIEIIRSNGTSFHIECVKEKTLNEV